MYQIPLTPQTLNRYSYANNNPVKYVDDGGHIAFIPLLIVGAIVVAKVADYGWTAWDTYESGRVIADPNASRPEKMMASLNLVLAVGLEVLEPDDLLPVGLPIDDVARKSLVHGAKEALDKGGEEGLQLYIRRNLGQHADEALDRLGMGHPVDPAMITIPTKKVDQVPQRGWNLQSIQQLVKNPALTRKSVNKANGNSATRFYRSDGHYVVVDDVTGEVVQVSNLADSGWIDDLTNAQIIPIP